MKSLSPSRIALLALVLGTAGITTVRAQNAPAAPAPAPSDAPAPLITPEEKAQLMKAHATVLAENPDLKNEGDNLRKQYMDLQSQGDSASQADKDALKTQVQAHEEKMRAAILKIDPTLAPVLAKLMAARQAK